MSDKGKSITYRDAGVDIDAGERAVELMKGHMRSTFNQNVLTDVGTFGAMFMPDFSGYDKPVVVSSTDSVGTKVKIASMTGRHTTVGQDLVNHCVNDILAQGAQPLYFLDYVGTHKVVPEQMAEIVEGLSIACKAVGCALIGGETAEMPEMYPSGEYDLVGTITGIVDRSRIITGADILPGDKVIGLASNDLHTNGYTLGRRIVFEIAGLGPDDLLPWGVTAADALLKIHRCYAPAVLPFLELGWVNGMAHITGGGLPGNLVRILPEGCRAVLDPERWYLPAIFNFLQRRGNVPREDMYRTFNMGVGFTLVTRGPVAEAAVKWLQEHGETAWVIGGIVEGKRGVDIVGVTPAA